MLRCEDHKRDVLVDIEVRLSSERGETTHSVFGVFDPILSHEPPGGLRCQYYADEERYRPYPSSKLLAKAGELVGHEY